MVSYEIKLSATMTNQNLICDELHDFSNRQQRDECALIGMHFGLEEAMNSFAKCRWRKSGGHLMLVCMNDLLEGLSITVTQTFKGVGINHQLLCDS